MNTIFRGLAPGLSLKNAVQINPDDDLSTKYDWLKSASRDTAMGALSVTNRRTLILTPGVYTLTATLTLGTDYVDVVGLTGVPEDVLITKGVGYTVEQTCDTIAMSGFTIETTSLPTSGTTVSYGFAVNASDNTASTYQSMYFVGNAITCYNTLYRSFPVFFLQDNNGHWADCHATSFAWRCDDNVNIGGVFQRCTSWYENIKQLGPTGEFGRQSFGGGQDGVDVSGYFEDCLSGYAAWGGSGSWGCNVSGTLIRCNGGYKSVALQRQFTGLIIDCLFGWSSIAAGASHGGVTAIMSGTVLNTIITGRGSEGLDTTYINSVYEPFAQDFGGDGIEGGVIKGCAIMYDKHYASRGELEANGQLITPAAVGALTTSFANGVNSDVTITCNVTGSDFNLSGLAINASDGKASAAWSVSATRGSINVSYGIDLVAAGKTGTELKALLDGDAAFIALYTCALAGTGADDIDDSYSAQNFTGGITGSIVQNNFLPVPSPHTADFLVPVIFNGQLFTNSGASGAIAATLPPAVLGLRYRFEVRTAQALRIDPNGTETLNKIVGGSQLAAGEYVYSSTVGDFIEFECKTDGDWEAVSVNGTWAEETP